MTAAAQRLQVGRSVLTRRVAAYRLARDERTDDNWSMVDNDDDDDDEWTLVNQLQPVQLRSQSVQLQSQPVWLDL